MNYEKLSAGKAVPDDVNVVIEIPIHSGPVKYEVDKVSGTICVDRFMRTAMYYPCNYGYIPNTLSNDGDPVDVLVVSNVPLMSGCVIRARPIGMLRMTDESGVDAKILAVPVDKITKKYSHVKSVDDIDPGLLASVKHFFEHYKDLEEGKWVKIDGWTGVEDAKAEILESVARFEQEK